MNKFDNFNEFLLYIEKNYSEEDQLIIENFMSYYINEYRDFGKYNCKKTYEEYLDYDKTGELHKRALIGFEYEKKKHDEREFKKYFKSLKG